MKARCGLKTCDCEYTIDKLVGALEAADELWAMLPFDSGEDIAEIAERVQEIQWTAIDKEKRDR